MAIWIKVAAWMLDSATGDRYILSSGGQTSSVVTGGMTLFTMFGTLRLTYRIRDPPQIWSVEDMVIEADQWYHVTATWSQDGDLSVYLNGNLWNQVSAVGATVGGATTSSVMYAAKPNNFEGEYGEICLDEWLFWRRVLSGEEVKTVSAVYNLK